MARICNQMTTSTGGLCTHPVDDDGDHCAAGHRSPLRSSSVSRPSTARTPAGPPFAVDRLAGRPARRRVGHTAPMVRRVRALRDDALFAEVTPPVVDVGRVTPEEAIEAIAGDPVNPTSRRAVVQAYGTVGAWLVCGYEDAARREAAGGAPCAPLDRLVSGFPFLDADQIASALDALDAACGAPDDASSRACHRMEAAYAVAARDGSPVAQAGYRSAWARFRQTTRSAA